MRIIALLATYNEERFIASCLEHLFQQGAEVYLLDNDSTDQTVAIAERYLGRGLIGIETIPRAGMFSLAPQLERKEQLAAQLDGDWFMHVDADEIRLPPRSDRTLAEAFTEVEARGYNAVNFLEYTLIPTREAPDHDHPDFQSTMRWYYPFLPVFPHRLNAWKRQSGPVSLVQSGGHRVQFPGLRMNPESFRMRHYLFLSIPHLVTKYVDRRFDPAEVQTTGWHGWRHQVDAENLQLPSQSELRRYTSDDQLDPTEPRTKHHLAAVMREQTWLRDVRSAMEQLLTFVPRGEAFILVDDDSWKTDPVVAGRRRIPFMERDGQYWGAPPDDETAVCEFHRLRETGAACIAFASTAFWWLDYYPKLSDYLRSHFDCILRNDQLVLFDLHGPS